MDAKQMWDAYTAGKNLTCEWDAWAFGCDADALSMLTLTGTKTATSSLHMLYGLEGEQLPAPGEHSIILDSKGEAVCIIRTERVFMRAFRDVDARQAWKEGEGDRSIGYWRKVHSAFFSNELSEIEIPFTEDVEVVCEEFVRVYP